MSVLGQLLNRFDRIFTIDPGAVTVQTSSKHCCCSFS